MTNDLISREALRKAFHEKIYYFNKASWDEANALIDSAPTVEQRDNFDLGYIQGLEDGKNERPQKVVTIPHELIEKLVLCVVDTVENIDWDKAIEAYKERPHGKWIAREDMEYLDENKVFHNYFECNKCGLIHDFIGGHTSQYNFCPNCGAKMDGEEADNETDN